MVLQIFMKNNTCMVHYIAAVSHVVVAYACSSFTSTEETTGISFTSSVADAVATAKELRGFFIPLLLIIVLIFKLELVVKEDFGTILVDEEA